MSSIVEVILEFFLLFEDFKFWKKKKKRRKLEKEKGLPKKVMIYPSDRYLMTALLIGFILFGIYFFVVSPILDKKSERVTMEKMVQLEERLNTFLFKTNVYPNSLLEVIYNNPLEQNKITDEWNNEFHYVLSKDKLRYTLISKGKDGKLKTKDDIK